MDHIGIQLRSIDPSRLRIMGNEIEDVLGDGIDLEGHGVEPADNGVKRAGDQGILIPGDFAQVIGNRITEPGGIGVLVTPASAGSTALIEDNRVEKGGHDGILVTADNASVRKNGGGAGPETAGRGLGQGTVASISGNRFGTGGVTTLQRPDL